MGLPVSLFPNSSKPRVVVHFGFGSGTSEEFLNSWGRNIEEALRSVSADGVEVETVKARYEARDVRYTIDFKWGAKPRPALKEVQTTVQAYAAQMPEDIRDSMWMWPDNENGGFLAVSFFSATRSLDEIYDILDASLMPHVKKVQDAD